MPGPSTFSDPTSSRKSDHTKLVQSTTPMKLALLVISGFILLPLIISSVLFVNTVKKKTLESEKITFWKNWRTSFLVWIVGFAVMFLIYLILPTSNTTYYAYIIILFPIWLHIVILFDAAKKESYKNKLKVAIIVFFILLNLSVLGVSYLNRSIFTTFLKKVDTTSFLKHEVSTSEPQKDEVSTSNQSKTDEKPKVSTSEPQKDEVSTSNQSKTDEKPKVSTSEPPKEVSTSDQAKTDEKPKVSTSVREKNLMEYKYSELPEGSAEKRLYKHTFLELEKNLNSDDSNQNIRSNLSTIKDLVRLFRQIYLGHPDNQKNIPEDLLIKPSTQLEDEDITTIKEFLRNAPIGFQYFFLHKVFTPSVVSKK